MSIRVLLVDDSPQVLRAAALFLAVDPEIEVIGQARSGHDALQQVDLLDPDLVLTDLSMPGMDGLEVTRRIKAQPAAPRVVILTLNDACQYRAEAEAACTDGFVAKSRWDVELLPLIHALFAEPPKVGQAEAREEGA